MSGRNDYIDAVQEDILSLIQRGKVEFTDDELMEIENRHRPRGVCVQITPRVIRLWLRKREEKVKQPRLTVWDRIRSTVGC